MQPSAHISIVGAALVSMPFNTSGAMNLSVPASVFSVILGVALPAIPKSTIFILVRAFDSKRTFSSFKSLCIIPYEWQTWIPSTSYLKMALHSISGSPSFSSTYATSSPPSAYSIMRSNSFLMTIP